jgi:hypothetical protein
VHSSGNLDLFVLRTIEGDIKVSALLSPLEDSFFIPSTTRGPVTVFLRFAAMCSDALRCAGIRSSRGFMGRFHGADTGSNPVGDAIKINNLADMSGLSEHTCGQKRNLEKMFQGAIKKRGKSMILEDSLKLSKDGAARSDAAAPPDPTE